MSRARILGAVACALLVSVPALAQEALPHRFESYTIDSGEIRNRTQARSVTFSETVRVEGATWLRLFFNETRLGKHDGGDDGTILRITSKLDGAVQTHTAETLAQWQNSSAFFNGDEVEIELIADANALSSRVRVHEVMVGEPASSDRSICGAVDDRVLSMDPRIGRVSPVGCTAWLIDDAHGCFLTAGHCTGSAFSIVEFDVPLSNPDGSTNHPPPSKQFAIDPASLQWDQTVIGNDWAYFGAFPNPDTQITPLADAGGQTFTLGAPPATAAGQNIRITGYGSIDGTQGTPRTWSQVQTTHVGPLVTVSGTVLRYATDTTGGDSGSAVFNEDTGEAIGIHTNAGCTAGGGSNQGTSLANAGVTNALANPVSICANGAPPIRVFLNTTLPDPMPINGLDLEVEVLDPDGNPASINAANLVYDEGAGDQTVPFTAGGGALWDGTLPPMTCGADVLLRIDVEATNGSSVTLPYAPQASADRRFRRTVAGAYDVAFRDNFETDQGWTVDSDASLSDGAWERGTPAGFGGRSDPPWDADTSGQAFVTDNVAGNSDVDGGATRLVSPLMDASSSADPHITYWRWYDDAGSSDDPFIVELSNDDGASWTTLETIGPNVTGDWVFMSFRVADIMTPTAQMRLRFTASDFGAGNIIEAGVDGVALRNTASGVQCLAIFSDGFESGNTSAWSGATP